MVAGKGLTCFCRKYRLINMFFENQRLFISIRAINCLNPEAELFTVTCRDSRLPKRFSNSLT
jgi:hypothetical protein